MTFRFLAAGLLPVALAACGTTPASLPDTAYIVAPASQAVAGRQTGYSDPLRNYTPRPVTDPSDWRQSNRSQEDR